MITSPAVAPVITFSGTVVLPTGACGLYVLLAASYSPEFFMRISHGCLWKGEEHEPGAKLTPFQKTVAILSNIIIIYVWNLDGMTPRTKSTKPSTALIFIQPAIYGTTATG